MSSVDPPITEEDLHALVDGELDAPRQDQVLARLATAPADQAKVDAWRQQNTLLRAAFAPVTHEPMPLGLTFAPCARVLAAHPAIPQNTLKSGNRRLWVLLAAGLVLGFGLGCGEAFWAELWPQIANSRASHRFPGSQAAHADSAAVALRVTQALDRFLSPKTTAAETTTTMLPLSAADFRRGNAAELQSPDLSTIGLRLTGATVMNWDRGPMGCFNFLSALEDRLVLCLARLPHPSTVGIQNIDLQNIGSRSAGVIGWQDATIFYAVSGLADADQLREIAHRIRAALPAAEVEKR